METFDFPYHLFSTKYPESGNRMQLGNSYVFASEPSAPDQRTITLEFSAMKYYTGAGGVISATINPQVNMWALELFYQRHKLWKNFIYKHPVYGDMKVKFNKPIDIPAGIPGGLGATKSFSIELIEMP